MNAMTRKTRGKPVKVEYHSISNPTPERMKKDDAALHVVGGSEREGRRVIRLTAPIERMRERSVLTGREWAGLDKYRTHWTLAGKEPTINSVDPNRVFAPNPSQRAGMAMGAPQLHHAQQFESGRKELGNRTAIVVDRIVLEDWTLESAGYTLGWRSKPQAIAAATEMLREAGYRLSKLWGLG